jgi:hypothetical protein
VINGVFHTWDLMMSKLQYEREFILKFLDEHYDAVSKDIDNLWIAIDNYDTYLYNKDWGAANPILYRGFY